MYGKIKEYLQRELADIKAAGLYKTERVIASPQRAEIEVAGRSVLNFCANNYLGLSDDERLIEAAKRAMDERGFGMSSVRFICGCQDIHKELERAIADYFGTEDTILYAACFDANGGVFEPLFTEHLFGLSTPWRFRQEVRLLWIILFRQYPPRRHCCARRGKMKSYRLTHR